MAQLSSWICGIIMYNIGYCVLSTNLSIISTIKTALFGVGYVSAIGTALVLAGDDIHTGDNDTLERVTSNLWFAGGLISCFFWVRCVHTIQS